MFLVHAVENFVKTLGETHLTTLDAQHHLANAYSANGQLDEAKIVLEDVDRKQKRVLGDAHLQTLASQAELAQVYWDLGDQNAATQLRDHIINIQRRALDDVQSDPILKAYRDTPSRQESAPSTFR